MQTTEHNPMRNDPDEQKIVIQDLPETPVNVETPSGERPPPRRWPKLAAHHPWWALEVAALVIAVLIIGAALIPQALRSPAAPQAAPSDKITQPVHQSLQPTATPQFRSPLEKSIGFYPILHNGVLYASTGLNTTYALQPENWKVLWQAHTEGKAFRAPTVSNGIVYVTTSNGMEGTLYALRADTGALLWQYKGGFARFFPNSNIVYIDSDDGITALHARDGTQMWHYGENAEGIFFYYTWFASDGRVFGALFSDSYANGARPALFSLRESDGSLLWQHHYDDGVGPLTEVNGDLYVSTNGKLEALQANDGSLLWSQALPVGQNVREDALWVENGIAYIETQTYSIEGQAATSLLTGQASLFNALIPDLLPFTLPAQPAIPHKIGVPSLSAIRLADGSHLWSQPLTQDVGGWINALVEKDGILYTSVRINDEREGTSSSYVSALQATDGKELWRYENGTETLIDVYYMTTEGLLADGEMLYQTTFEGGISALRIRDGSLAWHRSVDSTIQGKPVLFNSTLYTGAAGILYAIDAKTGSIRWHYLVN